MTLRRSERKGKVRNERRRLYLALGLVSLGVLVVAGAALAVGRSRSGDDVQLAVDATPTVAPSGEQTASPLADSLPIEVPDVTGEPLAQAEIVLTYAGLEIERRESTSAAPASDRTVLSQQPKAGELVDRGTTVILVHAPAAPRASEATVPSIAAKSWIVCIDPGHQRKSDQRPEPIGPGAAETKMRVTGGTTGVQTGKPEYVFTLELSQRIKTRLEQAGVKVVMTRTSHDVSISNAERAQIANRASADLFLRVHADGNTDRSRHGFSTLYPARNTWTAPIVDPSLAAAKKVHAGALASTGAADHGVRGRSDMTGFNWAEVPAIIVECGFMSNPDEDALLASPAYQDKLADGIVAGVLAYLEGR